MPQTEERLYTIRGLYRLYAIKLNGKALAKRAEKAGRSKAEQALHEIHRKTRDRYQIAYPDDSVSQFRKVNS